MRLLRPGNSDPPLPWRWQEWAQMALPAELGRFLDFGCGDGILLKTVADRCAECHGADVNPAAYAETAAAYPQFRFSQVGLDGRLDYPDGYFDTIAAIEVIEHVPDERAMLAELVRVLRPGGRLLITTRHRGLLTWLDPGNLKFVLPGLHRFVHLRVLRDREYYRRRFEEVQEHGLVGDISQQDHRPPWHRHYKPAEILAFCPESLSLQNVRVSFPGERAMQLTRVVLRVLCFGRWSPFPWPLTALDRWLSRWETRLGDNLVMMFVKRDDQGRPAPGGEERPDAADNG